MFLLLFVRERFLRFFPVFCAVNFSALAVESFFSFVAGFLELTRALASIFPLLLRECFLRFFVVFLAVTVKASVWLFQAFCLLQQVSLHHPMVLSISELPNLVFFLLFQKLLVLHSKFLKRLVAKLPALPTAEPFDFFGQFLFCPRQLKLQKFLALFPLFPDRWMLSLSFLKVELSPPARHLFVILGSYVLEFVFLYNLDFNNVQSSYRRNNQRQESNRH